MNPHQNATANKTTGPAVAMPAVEAEPIRRCWPAPARGTAGHLVRSRAPATPPGSASGRNLAGNRDGADLATLTTGKAPASAQALTIRTGWPPAPAQQAEAGQVVDVVPVARITAAMLASGSHSRQ